MAGEIIDRDLRQKNLPFYTGNEDPYGRGVIIQNQKYGIFQAGGLLSGEGTAAGRRSR